MDHYDNAHSRGRSGVWFAMLLVALLTGLAIWMVPDKAPEEVAEIPPPPAPTRASGEAAAPAPEPGAEAVVNQVSPGEEAEQGPEGSAARAFLARRPDATPEELAARAAQFREQGLAGDAWLLWFKAAREGSAEAALALAEQADPAYYDPATSALSRPDLVQARKWYRVAAGAGSPVAGQRLEQLYRRLEEQVKRGDERAALLLQEWKTKQ